MLLPSHQALLRRLEKRILVPLPTYEARLAMLSSLLAGRRGPPGGAAVDLEAVAMATDGFSGSDVAVLAKEAAMRPLRRLMAVLEPTAAATASPAPSSGASTSSSSSSSSEAAAAGDGGSGATGKGGVSFPGSKECNGSGAGARGAATGGAAASASTGCGISHPGRLRLGSITGEDMAAALAATKPSASRFASEYAVFTEQFGQVV